MTFKTIGKFHISVGNPYPVICELSHEDCQRSIHIHHKDLRDLQYAVEVMIRDTKVVLSETNHDKEA